MLLSQEEPNTENLLQEEPQKIILSRWIKQNRLNIEIDITTQLDFGLRNYKNHPIRFAKYKFESNNKKATIKTWLSAKSFEGTQYIGFFELDSIRDWLNMTFTVDEKAIFETENFFVFNLYQVFSNTHGINIQKVSLNDESLEPLTLEDSITRDNNVLKYFSPPSFDVYFEDGTFYKTYSNSGEIDIVASNMSVYGILSNTPKNLMLSTKDPNDTLINNYSNINVELINHVLDRLRKKGFTGVYNNLLNLNQLNDDLTKKLQDLYFEQLKHLLNTETHPNYTQIKDIIKKLTSLIIVNGENIKLDENKRYEVKINAYNQIFKLLEKYRIVNPTFIIKVKANEYINTHFICALLNIASFLNNRERNSDTIVILNEVKQIANEHYQKIDAAQDKYTGVKRKYMKLKSLYGII
jgi:hypothetical protein